MGTNAHPDDVYIVDGRRTPQLKARGMPGPFHAADLAHAAARGLLLHLGIPPEHLDEVILGCVAPGPDEANIARVVALRLGCDPRVPAWTVQRNCASGMQALDSAAQSIRTGRSQLVLAGGTEAMSHTPVLLSEMMVVWLGLWSRAHTTRARARLLRRLRPAHLKPVIGLMRGLVDPVVGLSMGQTAEELATRFNITREAMDAYALQSHQRLAEAIDGDLFTQEIVPLYDRQGHVHLEDDGLRRDTSAEKLAQLHPVFDRFCGTVTAGNSAQISDGAAALLLASGQAVQRHGLPVLGRILDTQWAGLEPEQMGLGPVFSMAPILERQQLSCGDIDHWEINEAFAAQVLACLTAWRDPGFWREEPGMHRPSGDIDRKKINPHGGGISLGHPVGASGARIVLHLLHSLCRSGSHLGMASLCVGGGQGGAMLLERCEEVFA